jgi:hypothetical protein
VDTRADRQIVEHPFGTHVPGIFARPVRNPPQDNVEAVVHVRLSGRGAAKMFRSIFMEHAAWQPPRQVQVTQI